MTDDRRRYLMNGDADGLKVGCVVGRPGITPAFVVLDGAGQEVEPITRFLVSISLSDYPNTTIRSYAYGLLKWFRVLWFLDVPWDTASRTEADCLVGHMRNARNPQRFRRGGTAVPGSINLRTGKPVLAPGYAATTINHTLSVIRSFYEHHHGRGDGPVVNPIPANPAAAAARRHRSPIDATPVFSRGALRQRVPRLAPRSMSDEQWDDFYGAMRSTRDKALILMFVSSGARASELLGVRMSDVDWSGHRFYVTSKGSRARQPVPASPEALRALAAYLDERPVLRPTDLLWRTLRGPDRLLTYTAMRRMLQRANEKLGTNWTAHDLRHTAAMRLARDAEMPIVHTQAVLRHAHLATTTTYLRADTEEIFAQVQQHFARPRPTPQPGPGYDPEDMKAVFGD